VNAGAFLGIMLYYGFEKISWSWGFGLAGIFMFFGMLQFYFTQDILENWFKKP
jgi:POT family proton-dependent oligopeptide transporter